MIVGVSQLASVNTRDESEESAYREHLGGFKLVSYPSPSLLEFTQFVQ